MFNQNLKRQNERLRFVIKIIFFASDVGNIFVNTLTIFIYNLQRDGACTGLPNRFWGTLPKITSSNSFGLFNRNKSPTQKNVQPEWCIQSRYVL